MLKLPPRMEKILLLVHGKKLREVDVAEGLGISKQAVSKALKEGRGRLAQLFLSLAETLNADIIKADISKGYAIVRIRQLNAKAYLIYVPGDGLRVLFRSNINCSGDQLAFCKRIVDAAVKWRIINEDKAKDNIEDVIKEIINRLEK